MGNLYLMFFLPCDTDFYSYTHFRIQVSAQALKRKTSQLLGLNSNDDNNNNNNNNNNYDILLRYLCWDFSQTKP